MGVFALFLKTDGLARITLFFVNFAVGDLLGDTLVRLLLEAFEAMGIRLSVSLCVIVDILIFFVSRGGFASFRHHQSQEIGHPRNSLRRVSALGFRI